MRFSKAWTVASKDLKIFKKKRGMLFSMIGFELFVSVGLPLVIQLVAAKKGGIPRDMIPILIEAFSFWFVIGAAILPISIASYSLVGEKVERSLEPILATPTTDEEILMGKGIAAFIPAFVSTILAAIIFMVVINQMTFPTLKYLYFPNWNIAVLLLLLAPLACLFSIGVNVIISSRISDIRSAQQVGMLMILPFGTIYFLSEIKVISLTTENLLIFSAILSLIDLCLLLVAQSTFRREEILTKWK